MTISQKIKMALAYKGMSEADLARAVGSSPQAFNQRMKTGKFSSDEMDKIADALEASYFFGFEFKAIGGLAIKQVGKITLNGMRFIRPDSYPATVNNLVDTCRVSLYVYPFGEWHQCLRIFSLSSQHRASCRHHINNQNVFFHSIRY